VSRRYETAKLIAVSDLLICQGSTLVFDAHILGTPTLTFDYYQTPGYDMWAKAGGIWHVIRQSDLLPSIRRMLEDSAVRSKLDAERQAFLQEYIRCDGHATERIVNVLRQMIERQE
jgi:predicted glycosyltransferase